MSAGAGLRANIAPAPPALLPRQLLGAGCIAAPWLVPFAPGPSANAVPWLAGAGFTLGLFLLAAPARPARSWLAAAAAVLLFALSRPTLDGAALLAAVALVLGAATLGRGRLAADGPGMDGLVASGWLAAAAASAAIALLQYFHLAGPLQPWVYPAAAGDAMANLRQPNLLASLLAIGLASSLWWAGRGARLAWLVPAVVLLSLANAATTSRTGLLHWLLLAVLAAAWRGEARRSRLVLSAIALATYGLGVFLLPPLLAAWTGAPGESLVARVAGDLGCSSRRVLWSNVLQLVAQRPWLGWGWGELDYAHYMHLYPGQRFCAILDNAHNLPLHVAVELGVPAALLLCVVVAGAVWRGRPWAEADPGRRLAWSVLAVLALHSLLEYPLWYAPFQVALGLSIGLLAAPRRSRQAPPSPGIAAGPAAVVASLALVLLAYAAWDYLRVSQIFLPPQQRQAAWRDHALEHARRSWLFAGQARFAEVTLTPLTPGNAAWTQRSAQDMLHYSPEPRVIEKVLESATMLERYDEAVLHLARYRAAFPREYARWRAAQKLPMPAPP